MSDQLDEDQLESWLLRQGRPIVSHIATRATLRLLPKLYGMVDWPVMPKTGVTRRFALPLFRGLRVAWFADNYPTRFIEILPALTSSSNAAKKAATTLDKIADRVRRYKGRRAFHATRAGYASVQAATTIASLAECAASANDDTFISKAVHVISDCDFQTAINADINAYKAGRNLNAQPLWLSPVGIDIERDWLVFKDLLLRRNKLWRVWTDWYEDRLHGESADEGLERDRQLIPNEMWARGPNIVNAEIRKLEFRSQQT